MTLFKITLKTVDPQSLQKLNNFLAKNRSFLILGALSKLNSKSKKNLIMFSGFDQKWPPSMPGKSPN
jgi:hypothetical protein